MAVAALASPTPSEPFLGWSQAHHLEGYGFVWWLKGHGALVTQTTVEHADAIFTTAISDYLDDNILARHWGYLQARGGLTLVHDWRSVRSYDQAAAADFVARMRRRPKGYLKLSCMVLPTHNTLVRYAVHTASAIASLTVGRTVEITASPAVALARAGISATPELTASATSR